VVNGLVLNVHYKVWELTAVSCVTLGAPTEKQFEMLSQMGTGTCITWGVDASTGSSTF